MAIGANGIKGHVLEMTAAADAVTTSLCVLGFRWAGMSNSTHTALLKDKRGIEIWHAHADTSLADVETMFPKALLIDGITVDTLGSGEIYVYLE